MARKKTAPTPASTEPETIGTAVDQVLESAQADPLEFDPAKLERQPGEDDIPMAQHVQSNGTAALRGFRGRAVETVRIEDHDEQGNIVPNHGVTIRRVDDGNREGQGIDFQYDDAAERPSEAVKALLKADRKMGEAVPDGEGEKGNRWNGRDKLWQKQVNPRNPVASRLNEEATFADVVEQTRAEKGDVRGR